MKKEKCVWLVCILLCFSSMVEGQTITVENGIAISSLRKSDYDNRVCPYQIAVGYEYADKGWFNLSSSIGYLKKGGKMHLNIYEDLSSYKDVLLKANIHYLTLNTVFNLKKTFASGVTAFVGAGPRLDLKMKGSFTCDRPEYGGHETAEEEAFRNVVLGLKCVVGVNKKLGRIPVGLQFAYLPNLSKMAKDGYVYHDRTFTLGLVFGLPVPLRDKHQVYSVRQK